MIISQGLVLPLEPPFPEDVQQAAHEGPLGGSGEGGEGMGGPWGAGARAGGRLLLGLLQGTDRGSGQQLLLERGLGGAASLQEGAEQGRSLQGGPHLASLLMGEALDWFGWGFPGEPSTDLGTPSMGIPSTNQEIPQ